MPKIVLLFLCVLAPFAVTSVFAVEVLPARELASHCTAFPDDSTSADGEYCVRYIQGFIDGAVATDARVMLNMQSEMEERESFSERAKRTRVPNRRELRRAAEYAEFCLGDPVPLREVVTKVVDDLNAALDGLPEDATARDFVYQSLRTHYPCDNTNDG